ncbi:MAG: hypothetical protein H6702_04185 [Myxococcales bacterium]|nr:hypothetical protein [Myxococcales bacterium]
MRAQLGAAPSAQALRSQVWAGMDAEGELVAEATVQAMPALGPVLGRSLFYREAQVLGRAGELDAWASEYAAARVPLLTLARQMGALQVLAGRGIDPATPQAYQAEVAAMGQVSAAPAVSEARAAISPEGTAGALDGWLAARQATAAAHAGLRAAAEAAHAEAARGEAQAMAGELAALAPGRSPVSVAQGVLALIKEIQGLVKALPETPLAKAEAGLSLLSKVTQLVPIEDAHAEQRRALKARIGALEAKARAHGQTAAQQRLVEAARAYDAAALRLRAEGARVVALHAARRRQLGNLGLAIDEQRSPGADPPVAAPGPDASDRATALLTAAAALEVAQQAAEAALQLLSELSGPELVWALRSVADTMARSPAGGLHPLLFVTEHGPSRVVQEAADAHLWAERALTEHTPALAAQAAAWQRLVGPLTGR